MINDEKTTMISNHFDNQEYLIATLPQTCWPTNQCSTALEGFQLLTSKTLYFIVIAVILVVIVIIVIAIIILL